MSVTENIDRIEQGKTSIISSIKSKGVNVPNNILINEIAPYINEIQGGSGGGDVPEGEIVPGGPHNPENDAFEEDFLWIENVDDKDGTITLNLEQTPFIYYSYDDDTEFRKMVSTNILSIPAHSKIYLRWKGGITVNKSSTDKGFIKNVNSNCNHNIGGELKNGGLKSKVYEYLFHNDKKLIDASELKLSATTLASSCYYSMFYGCTSLTTAPAILPATTLASSCYYEMFYGCTSLTTAPQLPATQLASQCYYDMFFNCNSLTTAPELPATTLAEECYLYMFNGCTALTTAPQLPATQLASQCYNYMFQGCTSLTTAPQLPATQLASQCYYYMFYGCTSLTTAPAILPATTLAEECYRNMFYGCSSLTTAPAILPATTLAEGCYYSMFSNCRSLTTAPALPATTLASSCYNYMFSGCTSLNYVKTNAISWSTLNASNWLNNVTSSGIVEVLPSSPITENSISGIPSGWTKRIDPTLKNTINIHNISGLENTISIPNKFSAFKYKTNNDTEYTENPKSTALTITLKSDETLTIEGIYNQSTTGMFFNGITSTENINVSGEVNYSIPNMFCSLFGYSTKLIDASQLKLTATKLEKYCYCGMFNGCTSLTQAPSLSATELATNCCGGMFQGCTSLTTAPELPATELAENCYFVMFQNCTSLTIAPALPATKLTSACYKEMFSGCSKINSLTFLSTEPFIYNDNNAKNGWLQGVSSTGTFRTPITNKEWIETYPRGTSAVPSGWTIEYI